jgi:hypothetical protein
LIDRDDGDESERIKGSADLRLRTDVLAVPVTPRSSQHTPRSHASPNKLTSPGSKLTVQKEADTNANHDNDSNSETESPAKAKIKQKEKELEDKRRHIFELQQQQEAQQERIRQLQQGAQDHTDSSKQDAASQEKPQGQVCAEENDAEPAAEVDNTSTQLSASPNGKSKKSRNRRKVKNLVKPGAGADVESSFALIQEASENGADDVEQCLPECPEPLPSNASGAAASGEGGASARDMSQGSGAALSVQVCVCVCVFVCV